MNVESNKILEGEAIDPRPGMDALDAKWDILILTSRGISKLGPNSI
jgi:hypothetical protein